MRVNKNNEEKKNNAENKQLHGLFISPNGGIPDLGGGGLTFPQAGSALFSLAKVLANTALHTTAS